jgi:hypothetical protein
MLYLMKVMAEEGTPSKSGRHHRAGHGPSQSASFGTTDLVGLDTLPTWPRIFMKT